MKITAMVYRDEKQETRREEEIEIEKKAHTPNDIVSHDTNRFTLYCLVLYLSFTGVLNPVKLYINLNNRRAFLWSLDPFI